MDKKPSPTDKITESPQFKSFMKKLALMGALLTLAGLIMKLTGSHAGATLLMMGMGSLSLVAFFLGSIFPCPYSTGLVLWKFAMTLTGYSLACVIIGLLFLIMHWPGGPHLSFVGLGTLLVSAIAWLAFYNHYKKNRDNQTFEE